MFRSTLTRRNGRLFHRCARAIRRSARWAKVAEKFWSQLVEAPGGLHKIEKNKMWAKQCHKPPIWEWFIPPIKMVIWGWFIIVYPHYHI